MDIVLIMIQSWNHGCCIDHDPELKPKILYWPWSRVETEDIVKSWFRVETMDVVLIMIQSWLCIAYKPKFKPEIYYLLLSNS